MDFHFLHAADIHLDSPLRGLSAYEGAPVTRFRAATRAALHALVDTAIDGRAAFLVIAGDLYDGDWPDFGTGLVLVRDLQRLKEAGIPVVVLFGNHDAANRITRALPWPDNAHVFPADQPATIRLDAPRVALHGQSFATAAVTENLAAGYPPPLPGWLNIGVLHTALEGHARHARYAPCSLAHLQAHGYDYWALGHVHEHAILSRAPWVVYPGVLQGRHMRETGPKGCVSVTVRDGRVTAVTPVVLDAVRWLVVTVDADGRADPDALRAACAETVRARVASEAGGRPVAVRVRLGGITPAHAALAADREALEANLRARLMDCPDVWVESVRLETRPPADGIAPDQREAAGRLAALLADADRDPVITEALATTLRPLRDKLRGDLGRLDADTEAIDAAEDQPLLTALRADDIAALVRAVRPDLAGLGRDGGEDR